eukprot:s456_g33.t1
MLAGLWTRLGDLETPCSHLAALSTREGVPPGSQTERSRVRGDDLLPIDPKAVIQYLSDKDEKFSKAVLLMVNTLNYLTLCPGGEEPPEEFPSRPLSVAQQGTVEHLCTMVEHLENSGLKCPGLEESSRALVSARFDYTGEPVVPMEDIIAEKVIAAWPKEGEAAIQDAVDYLPPPLRKKLLDPGSCLKQLHEWPARPPASKVRATDKEWEKVVRAGYKRGLMVPVEEDEVFRDLAGNPVVSGAGAVPKMKSVGGETKHLQRFISNLIPANAYQDRLDGDDRLLPYLGQLTLLEQGEQELWLVDAEDFVSCFNLFRLPPCWHRYMAFEKKISAEVFGGAPGKMVYAAMAVLPMGWISSVAVIQTIVRSLVFAEAQVPPSSEIAKTKKIPQEDDLSVIYLDSFDQLRRMDVGCREVLKGVMSDRHKKFLDVCREKGLPLNEGKRVVAATKGSLQGGELDGQLGTYGLSHDKMSQLLGLGAAMLSHMRWGEFLLRHFVGKATCGMCFRRPLLSVFQCIFEEIQDRLAEGRSALPSPNVFDEVVMVMSMVPMFFTNLRAPIDPEISVTDASPSGGGAAVATQFRREPVTIEPDKDKCYECGTDLHDDDRYPCPAACGGVFCSLACVMAHREVDHALYHECPRRAWRPPKFGERFAGERAPLSMAVAMEGHLEVQPPYDLHFGQDIFTEDGRAELNRLMQEDNLFAEHWAPECKLFTQARGIPIKLKSGRVIDGPQPVRDAAHLMGYPWSPPDVKARVRKSNTMVLKTLKRAKQKRPRERWNYVTVEHPYRSWLWEFTLVKEMERDPMFSHSVGSCCCFGGAREKWFSFFGDLPSLPQFLERDCPGHVGLKSYQVEELEDGSLYYPTSEEAEYPWGLCKAYAKALRLQLDRDGIFEQMYVQERERHFAEELTRATSRLGQEVVIGALSSLLARAEMSMQMGQEMNHLRALLRSATYRGTDVRFTADLGTESEPNVHEVPYLAMRWQWKTVLAFPWKTEGHINELEVGAFAVFLKRRGRTKAKQHTKFFHVLDFMVCRGALAKGRSSSKRLNRVLRRCGALMIAMDGYCYPLWTISAWNFADRPSRMHEKKAFLAFVKRRKLKLRKPAHLDRQIAKFIDVLYQEGEPMSFAGHLLSAVKRFHPQMRLQLPCASQLFRNWQRCYVPTRALPASWALVEALMGVAFHHHQPLLALLYAIAFNCLLRTSELMALTHKHVVLHEDRKAASVILPGSKTSQGNPQIAAAKNADQVSKTLRHPNVLHSFTTLETEGGFYIVTEEVVPLPCAKPAEGDERTPAVWGLYQAGAALDGLSFLHSSGFTHGLFGPLAIFVNSQGDYRLGSFELCQKGMDTGTAIASRRRVGPTFSGWPEPPAALQEGGIPSIGIDMWGAAVLIAYVFASASAGSYGMEMEFDLARAQKDIPTELRKSFQELQNPKPLRGRSPIAETIGLPFFQKNAAVEVFSFLANLQLKSPEEKETWFEGLPHLLEGLSAVVKKRQVLPELLTAQRFPGQEAAHLLPSILKIGVTLKEEEFREKVAPLVVKLFASPDRAVRFRLLTSLGDMIEFLDDAMLNDKIFPECVNGFTDSNAPIREATVKSMIFFVSRLKPKIVEGRDPEASIRTNALICVGRVSTQLPQASITPTLMTVIGMGLKDPFSPCRCAALQTLSATSNSFSAEDLAGKLLPGVCHRLIDPDPAVGDMAFTTLGKLQEIVRQKVIERRQASTEVSTEMPKVQEETSSWAQGGSFYNPLSAGMDKVRQKFLGVAGSMNQGSTANPSPGAFAEASPDSSGGPTAPSAPNPPGPPKTGMRLESSSAKGKDTKAAGSGSALDFGDLDEPGGGWADDDVDLGDKALEPVVQDASDFGDDFFNEFDTQPSEAVPTPKAAPAPSRPAPAAPVPKAVQQKAAPKAKSESAKLDIDDDFWKEFDICKSLKPEAAIRKRPGEASRQTQAFPMLPEKQEFETNSWKTCLPIDRIADTSETAELEIQNENVATTSSRLSLAQCRLQKMDHLVVDRDILRGISLRETLNNAGHLWRQSPIDLNESERRKLWTRSRKVEDFDWFLSHTWLTPGRSKVLSLVVQSCWHLWLASWLILVTLAMVLCVHGFLPMGGTWHPDIMGFTAPCPLGGWVILAGCLAPLMGIAIYLCLPESCTSSPTCFLDVVSIHQTDTELMERGIYGLGGFLKVSKQLRALLLTVSIRILWSPPYLTRLWCVFEVAAFRTANPEGEIILHPLTIEIGVTALFVACALGTMFYQGFITAVGSDPGARSLVLIPALLPSLGAIRILRRQSFMRRVLLTQLRNFDVDRAECRNDFDRHYIEAAILHWYGTKEKFAEYVRGPLAFEFLDRLTNNHVKLGAYVLIILSAPVAAGLELCMSLWIGGAPWEVLLSRFIGMVVGTELLFCAMMLMVSMNLCDILAKPCCGFLLPPALQTALVWFTFAGMYAAGNAIGTAASSASLWISILYALGCFCGTMTMRTVTKWMLLNNERAASPASPQEFSIAHDDDDEVPPSASSESAPSIPLAEADTRDSSDDAPGMQKMMQEAFPMDKVQNGLGAAKSWVSWGWGNVVQGAKKIGDDIAKSEFVKETERIAQKAEDSLSQGASEAFRRVSQATDMAVNKAAETMTQLDQDIQSGIATTEGATPPTFAGKVCICRDFGPMEPMEEAKALCNAIFAPPSLVWYEDWKLWVGVVGYCSIWTKWLCRGLDWTFESKAVQCFSLDLINLHLLQYTSRGILMICGLLLLQSAASIYAVYSPHDLLKQGSFTSYSTYTRLGGSLVQACWIFMGQLLFAWFYVYSLYSSYSDIGNAEYLFWFAGFVSVQMTMFFARGGDSQLGHTWNVNQAIYVFSNVYRLSFLIDGDDEEYSFVVGKWAWLLRSFFGFVVNLVLRDFVGYSVPILLMNFHNPIDCVIYSVAVNFIVTLDDTPTQLYKVRERQHAGYSDYRLREKAKELQEQLNPKLKEAGESARKSLMGAAQWGAKTAIWFQSFGTGQHADDSDEEASGAAASSSAAQEPNQRGESCRDCGGKGLDFLGDPCTECPAGAPGAASSSASGSSGYPAQAPSSVSMPEADKSRSIANGGLEKSPVTSVDTEASTKEAADKAQKEAEEKAKKAAEEKAQKEAEEKAKKEAEEKAKKEAQEKAKKEAAEQAKKEAADKAQKEAEEKAKKAAEEKAQKEAEEKAQKEAEEKAKKEAEEKAKKEAEEKAKKEAAEQAKKEAEEKAKKEAEEKAQKEAEEKAKKEAEEKAKKEAEEQAKKEAEEKAKKEAEEKAKKEAEEKAKKEAEEQAKKEAEEKARKEEEDRALQSSLQAESAAQPAANGQSPDADALADLLG